MANKRFYKTKKSPFLNLKVQKLGLEKYFNFIRCKIDKGKLICKGKVKPNGCKEEYSFSIHYKPEKPPKFYITNPKIAYNKELHMYKEGNLCLYFPDDMPWSDNISIAKKMIPWLIEWIIFYELWLITGMWFGKAAPHGNYK